MAMPDDMRAKLIDALPLGAATERTITRPADLIANIEAMKARGFVQTVGENVADVMAVAVPLRIDSADHAVAIAGPIGRMEPVAAAHAARISDAFADPARTQWAV